MHYHKFSHHAVDDNNCNHQDQLSFEETLTPDQWELCHLGNLALVQIDSLIGYNICNCKTCHEDFITKTKFTRYLAGVLICTEDNQDKEVDVNGYSLPLTCSPKTLPH